MKRIIFLAVILMLGCSQQSKELSIDEIEQIKNEIIMRSEKHASDLENGDTIRSSGCFTYGMQKFDGEWEAVTVHVTHIPVRTDDEKWWSKYSPSNRSK